MTQIWLLHCEKDHDFMSCVYIQSFNRQPLLFLVSHFSNVTDKVDFQKKLDIQLQEIGSINVTEKFQLVLEPLSDIQSMLSGVSDTAMSALNQATAASALYCPFTDTYTSETILFPWILDRDTANTPYIIRGNMGNPTSYDRIGMEDSETYLARIYNKAGVCSAPSSCCIEFSPPVTCVSSTYADCDYGANCQVRPLFI